MKSRSKMTKALLGGVVLLLVFALAGTATAQTWTQLTPSGTPPIPRFRHSAVYDPTSNRIIVFGGQAPTSGCGLNPLDDTWVLTNANGLGGTRTWIQLAPTGPVPAARGGHRAVYDAANDRMIIFGGDSTGCVPPTFNDVWVLTGASGTHGQPAWTQLATSGSVPPGLVEPAVAYDSVRNKLIVFGGNASEGNCFFEKNDVWTLSNANGLGGTALWTHLAPSGTPPTARWTAPGIYDPNTDRFVIFGGSGTCGGGFNDTWVLSGVSTTPQWTQLTPAGTAPSIRGGHSAVYDPTQNAMTIFGACCFLNDTWRLRDANGIGTPTWSQVVPSGTLPAGRIRHAAGYDAASGRMIIFGGSGSTLLNDTWVLDLGIVVPFAAFNARVEIDPADGKFEVESAFTLGSGSDGIAPVTEIVMLELTGGTGSFSTTIPAGSFTQDEEGAFKFEGVINGVSLEAKITDLGNGSLEFKAEGKGANLSGFANPVTLKLTIGNDGATATGEAEFD